MKDTTIRRGLITPCLRRAILSLSIFLLCGGAARLWGATPPVTISPARDIAEGWYLREEILKEYEVFIDHATAHRGHGSATIRSKPSYRGETFGVLIQSIRTRDYRGQRVRLSGYVKAKVITGWAGMWLRVDGPRCLVYTLDNMGDRPVKGTSDWTRYSLVVDVPLDSTFLYYGLLLNGAGQVWMDDLILETVGREIPPTQTLRTRREIRDEIEWIKRTRPDDYAYMQEINRNRRKPLLRPVNLNFERGPAP